MATIRKKPSGKYELDWYDSSGDRQRVSFPTKREAEEAMREVALGLSKSVSDTQEPKPLKDALRSYTTTVSALKASHENEKDYLVRLYKFLRGQDVFFVHEVTAQHLDAFKAERLKSCKGSTVNREFNTYRHFFSTCLKWKWIPENPAREVENAAVKRNPRRVWTDQEFNAIVREAPPWAGDVFTAMRWTGAGPMEISRITWADVDFARGHVLLKRYKGTGEEFRRHIPMPPAFKEFLTTKALWAKQIRRDKPTDRVFLNSNRKPVNARPLSLIVRRIVARLGLDPGLTPYGVRHTFATELLEAGVGEDVVRRLMGHQDVRTLIQNYSHIRQSALSDAMSVRESQVSKADLVSEKPATNSDRRNSSKGKKARKTSGKRGLNK